MGTGWRRAFCTTIRRDHPAPAPTCSDSDGSSTRTTTAAEEAAAPAAMTSPFSPRSCSRLAFFSSGGSKGGGGSSNSSASRVIPPATVSEPASPVLRCRTGKPKSTSAGDGAATPSSTQLSQSAATASAPCSPRPPSPFAVLRNTLRLSRRSCGVCLQSVKAVRGTAVFIAECSHAFHFPCISTHVRTQRHGGQLVCPVCAAAWCQAPLLSFQPRGVDDDETASTDDAPIRGTLETAKSTAEASDTGRWSEAIKQSAAAGSKKSSEPAVEQDIMSKLTVKTAVAKKGGKDGDRISSISKSVTGVQGKMAVVKSYNDDEPLLSPGGSRFNPIPEAAEEYEGNDDPCASSSSSNGKQRQQHRQSDIDSSSSGAVCLQVNLGGADVAFLSTDRGTSHGSTTSSYVAALKVKTQLLLPLDSPSRRAPVDLVAVLDVGDGMIPPKFQAQKRALRLLLSSLGPNDRLSVIAYSSAAKRLLPFRRMNTHGHRSARHVLDRLVLGEGVGAFAEALRKAAKVLVDRRERNPGGSVVLLSDGQRHHQLAHQKGLPAPVPVPVSRHPSSLACMFSSNTAASGTRFAHLEIPVYGVDQRNNSGPISPPPHDSPEAAFARCVSGLFSVVAQDVKMELTFTAGVVAGVYSSKGQPTAATLSGIGGSAGVFGLGDMYSEEERELFVELRVPSTAAGRGESPPNNNPPWRLMARCSYVVPATRELVFSGGEQCFGIPLPATFEAQHHMQQQQHHHRGWLPHSLLPRSPKSSTAAAAAAAAAAVCTNPASERLKNQFLTARAVSESRRLAESSEFSAAAQILTSTRSAFLRHHSTVSASAEECARALEAELAELQRRRQQQRAMRRRRRSSADRQNAATMMTATTRTAMGRYTEPAEEGGNDGGSGEALTPTSAWRAAERLAKVAMMRKSLNRRVSDLHGFEDARF